MAANATRRRRITGAFQELFGAPPLIWARAPGRVDLMGSHTDYNLGSVLTLAIDLDVWIAGRPRADGQVRIHSLAMDATSCFRLDAIARDTGNGWSNYIRGVAAGLIGAGVRIGGFDAVIDSTIPLGSGLSSSAALECAAAVLFQSRAERKLSSLDTALLCQRAENEFVGVSCGILDQYTSYLGRSGCALLLDCGTLTHRAAPLTPLSRSSSATPARRANWRGRSMPPGARIARREPGAWESPRFAMRRSTCWVRRGCRTKWRGAAVSLSRRTGACPEWRMRSRKGMRRRPARFATRASAALATSTGFVLRPCPR